MAEPRTVVITGGTGALGTAVTSRFVELGDRVHVTWVNPSEVPGFREALAANADAVQLHEADVSDADAVQTTFEAVRAADGPVTVLANIVGGFAFAPLQDTSPQVWERMIRLNATTAFLCSRAALPHMRSMGKGRIINVSAHPAVSGEGANMAAYSAGKAAVWNLTQTLARELEGSGITVNAVLPNIIDTEANRQAMAESDRKRWLAPAAIAQVMCWLASDEAGIVTGSAVRLVG